MILLCQYLHLENHMEWHTITRSSMQRVFYAEMSQ